LLFPPRRADEEEEKQRLSRLEREDFRKISHARTLEMGKGKTDTDCLVVAAYQEREGKLLIISKSK
jgi:hypothetical protein